MKHQHKWHVVSEAWLHCMGCDMWKRATQPTKANKEQVMTNLDDILRRIAYWNGYDTAGEWERTGHEAKAQLEQYIADQVKEAVKEEKSIRAKLVTKAHKDGIADGLQMALYGVKDGSKEEKFIRHLLYSENIGDKERIMDKIEYTKRLDEILREYIVLKADDGQPYIYSNDQAITAIQQLNNEAIGETDIQVRGITQNKENPMHWTKGTKVDYELRQELRAVIGDDK